MSERGNSTALKTSKILKTFISENRRWGISELARQHDFAKSTVHGIVTGLVYENILKKHTETNTYECGKAIIRLGLTAISDIKIKKICAPGLKRLSVLTNQSIYLGVIFEDKIIVVDSIDSRLPLGISLNIGSELSKTTGSAGKIYFAYMPNDKRNKLINDKTIDTSIIEESVPFVLKHKYAKSIGELSIGISAVSAPVLNRFGELQAIIVLGGFTSTISEEDLINYGELISKECQEITEMFL